MATAIVTMMFAFNKTGRFRPGFAESHVLMRQVSTAQEAEADAITLTNLRTALNAENVDTTQIRISTVEQKRRVWNVYRPAEMAHPPFNVVGGAGAGLKSDIPNTCVQCELKNALLQTGRIYMAGIPDAIIRTDEAGPDFNAVPDYGAKFDAYAKALTDGTWGFKVRVPQVADDITSWANEAGSPFRLIIGVAGDADIEFRVGKIIQVRGVVMDPRGIPTPNGQWRIALESTGPGESFATLRNSQGFDATSIVKYGTVEDVVYTYTPYTRMVPVDQGTRKRGVGPLRRRGRSKPRRRSLV